MKRLYRRLCRKWCPGGMTLSALAFRRARKGRPWWRNRIDGFFLLFFGQHQHCQADYQKGRSRWTTKR